MENDLLDSLDKVKCVGSVVFLDVVGVDGIDDADVEGGIGVVFWMKKV